jgi:hypothetical protein
VIRSVAIAWLTGLLEGEAMFTMSGRSISTAVDVTDLDIIERVAASMEGHVYASNPSTVQARVASSSPPLPMRASRIARPASARRTS